MIRTIARTLAPWMLASLLFAMAERAPAQVVGYNTLQALQVTSPIPYSARVPGDFNEDGLSDLLLFNPYTSQMQIRTLTEGTNSRIVVAPGRTYNVAQGYFIAATGDFNGDGHTDIVFTSNNRDLYIWYGDGKGDFRSAYLGSYPVDWMLFGAGDVDGDGTDDLLWRDAGTCQFATWIMQNGARIASQTMSAPCSDYPVSIGYYTLRNTVSMIWTNAQTQLHVWDSTPKGWSSSDLGLYNSRGASFLRVLGGGYLGANISFYTGSGATGTPPGETQYGTTIQRTFDASNRQTFWENPEAWEGGAEPYISAGFVIGGGSTPASGLMFQDGSLLRLCEPSPVAGFASGPTVNPASCTYITLPTGWSVVGGLVNGIVPATSP